MLAGMGRDRKVPGGGTEAVPGAVNDESAWLLVGKFEPPRQRVATTPRAALLERLDRGLSYPLTLVVSPPGFGKTTLLTQWWNALRARQDCAAAWLTLDEDDGEVTRFVAHLILSAGQAGINVGRLEISARQYLSDANVKTTVGALIEAVHSCARRLVVILDDYHRLHSPAVDAVVEMLIRNAGPSVHVVVSGRDRPRLRVSDLSARGLVAIFEASDLILTLPETADVLGQHAPSPELSMLYARTEGWPVALQLAKLWLERGEQRTERILAFSGRSGEVANYLAEQVLQDLTPELQDFLLETSILERFDAQLADAVRARHDSRRNLEALAHFEALLVPLDAGREWFRYHHLFADFLHQRLLCRPRGDVAGLHRRAAAWLVANGDLLEAVKHALRAGDVDQAIELVRAAGGWELILSRGIGFMRNLLKNFSDEIIGGSPVLELAQTYLQIKHGDLAGSRRRLRHLDVQAVAAPKNRDYMIVSALLRTYLDDIAGSDWVPTLVAQTSGLDETDHLGRGTLLAASAVGSLGHCDMPSVERFSRMGIREMRAAGSVLGATYCFFHLAQSHFYRGKLGEAESVCREALITAEENYGADSALQAVGNCLLAQLLYWRNDLQEARRRLSTALPPVESHDGWFDVYCAAYQTAVSIECAAGDFAAAFALLERCWTIAESRGLHRLADLVCAWRLSVLTMCGSLEAADRLVRDRQLVERHRAAVEPFGWRFQYAAAASLARWHLAAGRSAAALETMKPAISNALAHGSRMIVAHFDVLGAVALRQRGETAQAISRLESALDYATTERVPRIFLDAGPAIEPLLQTALHHNRELVMSGSQRGLINELLASYRAPQREGPNELSARELEVLRELCQGRSNKVIGRLLDLSENTVKFHLKGIYRKLAVDSRTAAIAAAAQRGIAGLS
jgi:LuxR family transcriptional regulator, maltose regulon positive regulatory protein